MTRKRLVAGPEGDAGNSSGADIANAVNGLIDIVEHIDYLPTEERLVLRAKLQLPEFVDPNNPDDVFNLVSPTLSPSAGKTPLADDNNEIAEGWLNLEHHLTRLASALISLQTDRLKHSKHFEGLLTQVTTLQKELSKVADRIGETKLDNHSIDESLFSGVRENREHKLPVLNMVERGWLSDASYQEGMAEFMRQMGGSGIVGSRQYQADRGYEVGHRVVDASYAVLNIHNHANYLGMPGMAEITACINGYYFRTRHNDYKLMSSIQGAYLARSFSQVPQSPETVKALPTGFEVDGTVNYTGTQAGYMRDVKTQNPKDCVWELSYLECWIETQQAELNDPTDSFRHSNDGVELKTIFDRGRYLNYSGHKNRLENLPYHPMKVSFVDNQGVPQFGILQFRISSKAVATLEPRTSTTAPRFVVGNASSHYHTLEVVLTTTQMTQLQNGTLAELILVTSRDFGHTHNVRVTWNSNGQTFEAKDLHTGHEHPVQVIYGEFSKLPYNEDKAKAGVIDNTNRFKLVRDLRSFNKHGKNLNTLIRSRMARFEVPDLERLCETIPGLEGDRAFLTEEYTQYGLNDVLQNWQGATLNAAYYNRRYRFNRDDASGRVTANRGFNDPTLFVAKTTHPQVVGGFSWMIPLELILRTPREGWNPYNCPIHDRTLLLTERNNAGGTTSAKAYSGINQESFYFGTPVALMTAEAGPTDPADTANTSWVKDAQGVPRLLYGNGIRVMDYDGVRQRYPVYPLFQDYSHESNQTHWLRQNLKDLLKKAVAGNLTITEIDDFL